MTRMMQIQAQRAAGVDPAAGASFASTNRIGYALC